MRTVRRGVLPVALAVLVLSGCVTTTPGSGPTTEPDPTAGADAFAPDALVGNYSVEIRTVASNHEAVTDATILRDAVVTGSCSGDLCDLEYTVELKGPDGSTVSGTTDLTFDGERYTGTQTALFSCDGLSSLTTVEGGLEYSSETTITPDTTAEVDGRVVVEGFDIVTNEYNEITAAGRDAGCLKINFSGSDPFSTYDSTVGFGTRQP